MMITIPRTKMNRQLYIPRDNSSVRELDRMYVLSVLMEGRKELNSAQYSGENHKYSGVGVFTVSK